MRDKPVLRRWVEVQLSVGTSRNGPWTSALISLFGLLLVGIVGFFDYATGLDFILAIFYLIPIFLVTIKVGEGMGLVMAAASAGTWFAADYFLPHPHLSQAAIFWNTGIRLGMYVVMVVILAGLKEVARSEREQRLRLEEMDRLKNSLLGVAAHDLRSPLAVIKMYSEFLHQDMKDVLGERQARFLQIIRNKSEFMLRMVSDLLDIAKIESGNVELKLVVDDYGAFIREHLALMAPLASPRGVTLAVNVPPDPLCIPFDRDRLEQVVSNLVANAVKFSPDGSRVAVQVDRADGSVVTRVMDEGPGINRTERDKLFEAFQRGSAQPIAGEKGAGLGLAIAKKAVEAHGGRIWVESEPGHGACFSFSIPVGDQPVTVPPAHDD